MTIHQKGELETKLGETRHEENKEKDEVGDALKKAPEWQKLKSLLGERNQALFLRIITEYSHTSKQKNWVDKDTLKIVIEKVFSDPITATQLWYNFEWGGQKLALSLKDKMWENEDTFPEESLLKRLEAQGHLNKKDVEEFKKTVKNKSSEEQRLALKDFLTEKVKDKKVGESLQKDLFPGEDAKPLDEKSFNSTAFFQDAWEPKPPFNDFNTLIAENYTRVPNQQGEIDKQADFQVALERSVEKVKEKNSKELNQTLSGEYENFKNAKTNGERYAIFNRIFIQSQAQKAQFKKAQGDAWEEQKNQEVANIQQSLEEAQLKQTLSIANAQKTREMIAQAEAAERAREKPAQTTNGWDATALNWGKLDVASSWREFTKTSV